MRRQLGREEAIELLREWSREKVDLSLLIVIAGKFRLFLTDGDLSEEDGAFCYSTSNIENLFFLQDFEKSDLEETDTYERLLLSDSDWSNIMQIIRSKVDEPLPIEHLKLLHNPP